MADYRFVITGKEMEAVEDFIKNHKCTLKDDKRMGGKKVGAIGGQFTYKFTPTTIGTVITVSCACGQEKNVTDFENW